MNTEKNTMQLTDLGEAANDKNYLASAEKNKLAEAVRSELPALQEVAKETVSNVMDILNGQAEIREELMGKATSIALAQMFGQKDISKLIAPEDNPVALGIGTDSANDEAYTQAA